MSDKHLDHFRPPLSKALPWTGFHSRWATAIADELNRTLLPPRFEARANVRLLGHRIESEASNRETGRDQSSEGPNGWSPPPPSGTGVLDFDGLDLFEVQLQYDFGGSEIVAVVELVSPTTWERPAAKRAFAIHCANYLFHGISVVLVDIVTGCTMDLDAELMRVLDPDAPDVCRSPPGCFAIAYRARRDKTHTTIDSWPEVLAIGKEFPKIPLWIGIDVALPLDLEATYKKTVDYLRVPFPSPERNGK